MGEDNIEGRLLVGKRSREEKGDKIGQRDKCEPYTHSVCEISQWSHYFTFFLFCFLEHFGRTGSTGIFSERLFAALSVPVLIKTQLRSFIPS